MTQQAVAKVVPPKEVPAKQAQAALLEVEEIVRKAELVQVSNADEYEQAVQLCQRISAQTKKRTEERMTITRAMDAAKKTVMDFFEGTYLGPLGKVDAIIRGKLRAYDAEQKRIAEEKRKQVEAEARKQRESAERKAREEREKAEAKAKAEREEAARQRQKEEAARREAEEAKKRGDEEAERRAREEAEAAARTASKSEAKAEKIEEKAEEKVESLLTTAATIVAPVVEVEQPKVKGSARRTVWKWKVKDASKVDRRFLMLDEPKIGQQVRAMKQDAADIVGGIEVWEEDDLSIRAAKP